MLSIQTNVNSLIAQENLNVNNQFQSRTIQQLTSGYRINSSGDDAAGLAVAKYAMEHHELTRVFGVPFTRNVASCRVLEKAGFVFEGTLRRSAIKDGVIIDQCLYAFIP